MSKQHPKKLCTNILFIQEEKNRVMFNRFFLTHKNNSSRIKKKLKNNHL